MKLDELLIKNHTTSGNGDDGSSNEGNSELIYNGKNLRIEDIKYEDQSWYFCCLIFYNKDLSDSSTNDSKPIIRHCSSTYLNVDTSLNSDVQSNLLMLNKSLLSVQRSQTTKNWLIIMAISLSCAFVIIITIIIIAILHKKFRKEKFAPECNRILNEVFASFMIILIL